MTNNTATWENRTVYKKFKKNFPKNPNFFNDIHLPLLNFIMGQVSNKGAKRTLPLSVLYYLYINSYRAAVIEERAFAKFGYLKSALVRKGAYFRAVVVSVKRAEYANLSAAKQA